VLAQASMQHTRITAAHIRMCMLSGTKIDVNLHISRYYYKGLCVVAFTHSVVPAGSLHAEAMSAFWILNDEKVQRSFTTLLRRHRVEKTEDHRAGKKTDLAGKKTDLAGKKTDLAGKKTDNDHAGKTVHKRVRLLMLKEA
jgi:hypothetical protein